VELRLRRVSGADCFLAVKSGNPLSRIEVEFSSESQARAFTPPPWFGQEVTHDARYTNAELAG
jgi:CYTH domain-containing protein